MTLADLSPIAAALAFILALFTAIRAEQIRRATSQEELRKHLEAELAAIRASLRELQQAVEADHRQLMILQAQLAPLLDVFAKRIADLFQRGSRRGGEG